jgi:hypothetical protein
VSITREDRTNARVVTRPWGGSATIRAAGERTRSREQRGLIAAAIPLKVVSQLAIAARSLLVHHFARLSA